MEGGEVKVGVVGAYSSGKTTLVRDLLNSIQGSVLLEEQPRRVIAQATNIAMKQPEVRDYLIVSQLLQEAETSGFEGIRIADGALVNNLAHDRVLLSNPPDRHDLLALFNYVPYDAIFWCDHTEIQIEDDGQRFTGETLRQSLHDAIGGVLEEFGYSFHYLSGSRSERLDAAAQIIGTLGGHA